MHGLYHEAIQEFRIAITVNSLCKNLKQNSIFVCVLIKNYSYYASICTHGNNHNSRFNFIKRGFLNVRNGIGCFKKI